MLLIYCLHLFAVELPAEQSKNELWTEQSKIAPKNLQLICPPSDDGKPIPVSKCELSGYYDYDREQKLLDHSAQVSMKRAAWVTASITFLGLLLVGITLWQAWKATGLAKLMLVEAEDATRIAREGMNDAKKVAIITREMGIAQNRAWLAALDPEKTFYTEGNIKVELQLRFENKGGTPAVGVKLFVTAQAISNEQKIPKFDPDETKWMHRGAVLGRAEISKTSKLPIPTDIYMATMQGRQRLIIYGVAKYFTIFDAESPRTTEVTLEMKPNDPRMENPLIFLHVGGQNNIN